MKNKRQKQILDIISSNVIETQEELIDRLNACGYKVTQATISRDIKDLKLVKTATDRNRYRYVKSGSEESKQSVKYDNILFETMVSVDVAGHLIVIKTHNGMAMAAGAAIDAMGWNEIVGSIAGDDTVFVAVRTEEGVRYIYEKLNSVLSWGR
ncbi:MAG: arginine repressor [Clostridia bacterium]|jgi:transcriptional regulator of arginine metabolism|nr:arginine repressor [Clostridia bacterium]